MKLVFKTDDDIAIKVAHVSKKYSKSLKHTMLYGLEDIGRNLIGLGSNSGSLRKSEFWAVDDVSFELKKGETLGLIGPNGSGKTTILKMLNGIFWPDKGKITVKGRVGALIEVGAGFHPLLTGRENIYINAAILGMTKKEVDAKFDDIVKFADIGSFIDAPVRSYSSGMYVRLGFAVAVHCEPDVLLVDEALAVGDAAFRNKCYQRMNKIKAEKNVSIIYVSHDIYTVETFCDKGVLLSQGKISSQGEIHRVISDYQLMISQLMKNQKIEDTIGVPYCSKEVEITSVRILNRHGEEQEVFDFGDRLGIRIEYEAKDVVSNPRFVIEIYDSDRKLISLFEPHLSNTEIPSINKGNGVVECWIEKLPLLLNKYYVSVGIYDKTRITIFDWWGHNTNHNLTFRVLPNHVSAMMGQYTPVCHIENRWIIK
jgi:lipopolysaccharide transport system ATP-binding protein